MMMRPKVLYVDNKNNGSVLFLTGWERDLDIIHENTVLSAINLMGCKYFDFVLAEWSHGHRSGIRIVDHAKQLGISCALFTSDVYAVMGQDCQIWSKASMESIPDMVRSSLCHPSKMVIDSHVISVCAEPPLKTRIISMFSPSEKQHG